MSRESEVADLLRADAIFMSIMEGGVYTDEEVGVEGIRRGDGSVTVQAFDADGYLRPCALVRQRGVIGDDSVVDELEKVMATSQVVEIYYYQHRGHQIIDQGKLRGYHVLQGTRLTDSYPLRFDFETPHIPDVGPIANSTTLRQDWRVTGIRK